MSDDLQARIDRIAKLVLAKGSRLEQPSDTEVKIRRILEAWGPRTTYRYLRDHGLLEAFVDCLPLPTYEANDPQVILETFQKSWDDFTDEALAKLEAWQLESSEAALLPRLAAYAGRLFGSGHTVQARRVLRVAQTVAEQGRLETQNVKVEDLKVNDLVRSVQGSNIVGFGDDHLAGQVQSFKIKNGATSEVEVVVHVPQRSATYRFSAPVGTYVEIGRLTRPSYAQALRLKALDRLMRAEAELEGVPAAQSRVARLRHVLAATIASEHVADPQSLKFKVYVGPIGIKELAERFEKAGLKPEQVGTEHLYFRVEADSADAGESLVLDAAKRAGLGDVVTHREVRLIGGPAWDVTRVKDAKLASPLDDFLAQLRKADPDGEMFAEGNFDLMPSIPDGMDATHIPDAQGMQPIAVEFDADGTAKRVVCFDPVDFEAGGDPWKVVEAGPFSIPGRKTADLDLSKADKFVIDCFTDRVPAESKKLQTDGKRLDGLWMGGSGIAEWVGNSIRFNDLGSKAAQSVQRAIRKMVPAKWLEVKAKTAAHKCPDSPDGQHVPDPATLQIADGAGRNRGTDWILDANCRLCHRGGSCRIDPNKIMFDHPCTDDKHQPDPSRLHRDVDAGRNRGTDWIVDTVCRRCGQYGGMKVDPYTIDFD